MTAPRTLPRRAFVADLGRGAFALAILGVAGCAPAAMATATPATPAPSGPPGTGGPSGAPATAGTSPVASPDAGTLGSPPGDALAWHRVNLGFVSAYVLVRGGEAAIVDTGVAGSADAIEDALGAIGLDWSAVAHLVLTHHHGDHAGSASDVLERASGAAGYAGADDIGSISVPRPLTAVTDGDRVFDLDVVSTPGHTAGSICVLDTATGVLVAGDALRTEGGRPILPGDQFTADMDQAVASVAKLGGLAFETLLVGHGDPIEAGASAAVADLAAAS